MRCPFCHQTVRDLGAHLRSDTCDGPVERENPYLAWCWEDLDDSRTE
jgi:hypothetical protein